MAIDAIYFTLLSQLRRENLLVGEPKLLELGESNWYGDVPIQAIIKLIDEFGISQEQKTGFKNELTKCRCPFEKAKIFLKVITNYSSYSAIDFHGTDRALQKDLNQPLHLYDSHDMVINNGTGEHIFSTYHFFKNVHDATKPNGLMVHISPFSGWYDHGFYNFQPTLFFDIGFANRYHVLAIGYAEPNPLKLLCFKSRDDIVDLIVSNHIKAQAQIFSIFKMPDKKLEFQVPMQGYYAGQLSDKANEAWIKKRSPAKSYKDRS